MYLGDYCQTTTMLLAGTDDVSGLSDVVRSFSDGYKASSSMALDAMFSGAREGWRGSCLVYYSSEKVQDNTNGALCHVIARDTTATSGPFDFGESYLIHIVASNWSPPATSASIIPANLALSEAKYGIVHSPSVATKYLLTTGYYSTLSWYQPKPASSYGLVQRYGKSEIVAGYCMQGSGTTSYFGAPKESLSL